jgi:hypothetical protein
MKDLHQQLPEVMPCDVNDVASVRFPYLPPLTKDTYVRVYVETLAGGSQFELTLGSLLGLHTDEAQKYTDVLTLRTPWIHRRRTYSAIVCATACEYYKITNMVHT